MTHCDCSASLASEMVLCSSSNLACGALWINRQRLMSHVLPCSLQTALTGGGGERRAWKGSCFGNTLIWLSHLFVSGSETRFFFPPKPPLRSTSPVRCGWAVTGKLFLRFFFPTVLLIPWGVFSELAITHIYWQQRARTSTRHRGDKQPRAPPQR